MRRGLRVMLRFVLAFVAGFALISAIGVVAGFLVLGALFVVWPGIVRRARQLYWLARTREILAWELREGDRLLYTGNLTRGPYLTEPLHKLGGRDHGEVWVQVEQFNDGSSISVGYKRGDKVRVARR